MSDQAGARRVALLARPGAARDRMREALAQAGADIVLEADPTVSDPATVSRARPEVALIVLDAATDDALDRFDGLLSDPTVDVFFEEAELAMGREGWDAARWVRHLRAKLRHADGVLPPGRDTGTPVAGAAPPTTPVPKAMSSSPERAVAGSGDAAGLDWDLPQAVADIPAPSARDLAAIGPGGSAGHSPDRDLSQAADIPLPSEQDLAAIGPAGGTGHSLDWDLSEAADIPLSPERELAAINSADSKGHSLDWDLSELEAPILPPSERGLSAIGPDGSTGPSLDWDLSEAADIPLPSERKLAAIGPAGGTGHSLDWDLSEAADIPLPSERELSAIGPAGVAARGHEWALSELEAPVPPSDRELAAARETGDHAPRISMPPPLPPLELEPVDAPPSGIRLEGLELEADSATATHRFENDMADLHSRIAAIELAVDTAPASVRGAVLVLAGIGGPDAVRQLLSALPEGFPRPVLVQQRLDGGHYDRLVAQMQRATTLPVRLAVAGEALQAATIYILPSGVGVQGGAQGLVFNETPGDLPGSLPAGDSAVLMLSGSDPAQVDAVMKLAAAGALVAGQAPDGCYDAAAPTALAARGGEAGKPTELARRLTERWH